MKKSITVIVFALAFSALHATIRYQHEKTSEELVLNNGTKWKIDQECRMKGPDHLALHKWLEPLMEQVAQLNQATNAASAKIHINEVKKRLNIFNQYFKI
jgi:hypothetical protein